MAVAELIETPALDVVLPRPRPHTPWQPEEEAVLRSALAEGRNLRLVALKLGRTLIAVRGKAKRISRPRRHRPWTAERTSQLAALVECHTPWPEIARIIGHAEGYLKSRASMLGISQRHANGYTVSAVARMLAVDSHAVDRWARLGWLRARRTRVRYGHGVLVVVRHEDLIAYLEDERYWPAWEPGRIRDSALREWALELRAGVEYLTATQAAPLLFITPLGLQKAIREGRYPGVKVNNIWWIRRDQLRPMPGNGGPLAKPKAAPFSDSEKAVIRELWGVVPGAEIAARLGRQGQTVHAVARRLGLPRLGRGVWKVRRAKAQS